MSTRPVVHQLEYAGPRGRYALERELRPPVPWGWQVTLYVFAIFGFIGLIFIIGFVVEILRHV